MSAPEPCGAPPPAATLRPLAPSTADDLVRWYWTKAELVALARTRGVSAAGAKRELHERLAAALEGRALPQTPRRPPSRPGLEGALTSSTVIPIGQRCTQHLRSYFIEQLGPSFRFDGPMRTFITTSAGKTLGDALDYWARTRNQPPGEIGPQFELNRFLRDWHARHRGGTPAEAQQAWRTHRALPAEHRVDSSDPTAPPGHPT